MSGIAVWWDEAADGPTNMAADECLAAESLRRGSVVIRLYRWVSTTVSLGAFQRIAEARGCEAIADLPVVRRPSGGGAIVHGTDVTYAAAVPKSHPWGTTPQALYDAMHGAMAEVLRRRGVAARLVAEPRSREPAGPAAESEPFFCFHRRSVGDLVVDTTPGASGATDLKLMGSAQRRLAAAVLQHGSLLLSRNRDIGPQGSQPGLADLAGGTWAGGDGWQDAVHEWLHRVAASLGLRLHGHPTSFLASDPPGLPENREKFAAERWTSRR